MTVVPKYKTVLKEAMGHYDTTLVSKYYEPINATHTHNNKYIYIIILETYAVTFVNTYSIRFLTIVNLRNSLAVIVKQGERPLKANYKLKHNNSVNESIYSLLVEQRQVDFI